MASGEKQSTICSQALLTHSPPKHFIPVERLHSFPDEDENSVWARFEDRHQPSANEDEGIDRHSSDEEFDIWNITDEQREYYTNQFKSMQSNLEGKITGSIAKTFFEKSKLPVPELSKIWQLSDVDKDGALNIEEFCTAMHLVVLRRNNIDLPEVLPAFLIPKTCTEPLDKISKESSVQSSIQSKEDESSKTSPCKEISSPPSKEWTKFSDSPTSSLSSPGMKPVNFDFSAISVEKNPKILHPVPLRMSPERQNSSNQEIANEETPEFIPNRSSPLCTTKDFEQTTSSFGTASSFSGTSCTARSVSLSQGAICSLQGPKKDPPPPPPPRPKPYHIRSSSLDLNKLGSTIPHFLSAPPAVPPRISPCNITSLTKNLETGSLENTDKEDFADFSIMGYKDLQNSSPMLHLQPGAFERYQKPVAPQTESDVKSSPGLEYLIDQNDISVAADDSCTALLVDVEQTDDQPFFDRKCHVSVPPLALAAATTSVFIPEEKYQLLSAIQAHRERNMMLNIVNNELNQEFSEIMEERIALEIQLDQLKPFT